MNLPIRGAVVLLTAIVIAAACSFPSDNFPPQDPQFQLQIEEMNREAERQMEEMERRNEELFEQFGGEDDSLPLTGLGG